MAPELPGDIEPSRVDVDRHDGAGAGRDRTRDDERADGAGAVHHDDVARPDAAALDRVQSDGQRLGEGGVVVGDVRGDGVRPSPAGTVIRSVSPPSAESPKVQ